MVQDAFVKVLERSATQEVRALDRLLARIVRCVAIDRIRLRAVRKSVTDAAKGEGAIDPAADPERTLMGVQRLQRVKAVIEAMPARRREVFLLHRVEDLTYPQIARRIGVSVKAVEKHIRLAMLQLSDADD